MAGEYDMKYQPVGNLKPALNQDKPFVMVYRVGRRRKYQDSVGNIFVKVFNQWWRFPEEIEY